MRVVALISGGKDSCFNMMHCVANGHNIVALANLRPDAKNELDSHMFQTVGHDVIELYAEALQLPLFRRIITGSSVSTACDYIENQQDEVEDLLELLKEIKEYVNYDAVSSGAILSNYQRVRVENVCRRLGLQSLSYLWQRNQEELLSEMVKANLNAILIKVASLGLNPRVHLGKTLEEMSPHLRLMNLKFGLNVCGEGGEYETITLDCPLFSKRIVVDEKQLVMHSDDAFAPVGYLVFDALHLEDKKIDLTSTLVERMSQCDLVIPKILHTKGFHDLLTKDIVAETFPMKYTNYLSKKTLISRENTSEIYLHEGSGWITELISVKNDDCTIEEATMKTMETLKWIIFSNKLRMEDISLVNLFCSSMKYFTQINSVYKNFFLLNPPARVCVEVPLPEEVVFKMDICIDNSQGHPRKALHVESISYWAPANIGPYSQAVQVCPRTYFSGSIGMDPSSLNVVKGGFEQEATLSLHHVHEVAKVFLSTTNFADKSNGMVTCYIAGDFSKADFIVAFFNYQVMFHASNYLLNIVSVPGLPKGALVEWHVLLTHNELIESYDDSSFNQTIGDDRRNQLSYNRSYFKLSISNDSYSDEKLRCLFSQHRSILMKSVFIRVYYVIEFFSNVPDGDIQNSFINVLTNVIQKSPPISFIPVCGLEHGSAMLVTGVNKDKNILQV